MDKTNDTKSISKSRRNLIKASAAAPVIASLHPGAAAASSAFQCAIRDNNHYQKYTTHHGYDNAKRQKALLVTKRRHANNYHAPRKLFLMNPDGTNLSNHCVLYDKDGQEYTRNGEILYKGIQQISDCFSHLYLSNTVKTVWVLSVIEVDHHSASYIGGWPKVQLDGHNYTALTNSCWTSICE